MFRKWLHEIDTRINKNKTNNENARVFKTATTGMLPTLTINQRFAADCSYYKNHTPQSGEIVVFTHPAVRMTGTGVKRVIAIGDDIIEIKAGNVLLNNTPLKEPYILENSNSSTPGDIAPTKIPEGHVFVMGDNRSNSFDSRMWGDKFLPVNNIQCKVLK